MFASQAHNVGAGNHQARAEFIDRTRDFVVNDVGLDYPEVSVTWDGT